MKSEIYKVQMPIGGVDIGALVYNEHRSVQVVKPCAEVAAQMNGWPKRFFYGTATDDGMDVVLRDAAPWQEW